MNKEIELLNNKIDAQDKIINTQALEIARLEKAKKILLKDRKEAIDLFVEYKEKIDKANELLSNILVVKRYDGNYGAVKNTTKKEVYKTICMLNEVLETPHRAYYGILGDKE